MSLIERAVARISPGNDTPPPRPEAVVKPIAAPSGSLIEQAMSEDVMARAPAVATGVGASPSAVQGPSVAPGVEERQVPVARPAVKLDLPSLEARGFVTPDTIHGQIGEEFRAIKRPLVENALGRGAVKVPNGRRIMVTSAFPGEGKSFCSINLAISIAVERDLQVLLVDADVARPSIPKSLGISPGAGLIDRLVDPRLDLDELILETNIDKLSILTSGRLHGHATELLASDAMTSLLDELSNRYPDRLIIFDSPPVLLTTSARALTPHMGQVVVVVEAGSTPREAVKDTLALIGGPAVVGLILNKSPTPRAGGYYGYKAYGYGTE